MTEEMRPLYLDSRLSPTAEETTTMAETASSLVFLLQKSLATTQDRHQADRLQWALVWAGLEINDRPRHV